MPEVQEAITPASRPSREVAGIDKKTIIRVRPMARASHLEEVLVSYQRIEDLDKRNHQTNTVWMLMSIMMLSTITLRSTHQITKERSRKIGTT